MIDSSNPSLWPRVSLVLPVFNGETYLEEAIASIRGQSFTDFELIVVDDCSTDASPQLIAAAAAQDSRIVTIQMPANAGLPAALNAGFAAARGALHSWTSDDNILNENMLARLVAELDFAPDVDIVHADYCVIDPDGKRRNRVRVGPAERLLFGNCIGACFLYRRAVTERLGGYDPALFGVEDYDFWLRAARHFTFRALAEDLYSYRKHPRSLTNNRAAQIQSMVADIVERAMPANLPAADRARVLIALVLGNYGQWRGDLLRKALQSNLGAVCRAAPALARHRLRLIRGRWA